MRFMISVLSVAALSGCATRIPDIILDEEEFSPARLEDDAALPVELVETPKPFPLPGQLKPSPAASTGGGGDAGDDLKPYERIEQANAAATFEPDLANYVNAVQVYPYMAGALYQLYAAPEQVTDIALQPGEQLVSVSAGDTVRWVVGDTTSGAGAEARAHILVKPIAPSLTTNLVITTDRRAYHLEMRSFNETYMAAISWRYPQDALGVRRARNDHAMDRRAQTIETGVAVGDLRFRYEIEGDRPHWRPMRAFDDGRKVYIQFPARLAQGEAPPLFVLGANGDAELVNYRVKGAYYIVDRLFAVAELRLGQDPQQTVRIARTDLNAVREGQR